MNIIKISNFGTQSFLQIICSLITSLQFKNFLPKANYLTDVGLVDPYVFFDVALELEKLKTPNLLAIWP